MIHIERVVLPTGLRALAHRDGRGNLIIYVSETLDAPSQRTAVAEAMRALRRTGWRAGVPTAGIALLLAFRTWAGRTAQVIAAHRVAWIAAATTAAAGAAAAGFFLITVPHPDGPALSGGRPGPVPSTVLPSAPPGQQAAPPIQGGPAQPSPSVQVSPEHGQTGHQPGTAGTGTSRSAPPGPASSPTPPAPTPGPTPSPPAQAGSGACIRLLGIRLCLRL